jgi:hypothetical protein
MNTHVNHSWKDIVVVLVVMLGIVFSAQALEPAATSQEITLSATVHEPSGTTGTIAFTFALETTESISCHRFYPASVYLYRILHRF